MELVTRAAVDRALGLLALLLPVLGLLAGGAVARAHRRPVSRGAGRGLVGGLVGPLIWLLWRVTNAIQDRLGLDSVAALFVNFAIFIGAGLAVGFVVGRGLGER
jgi:lipopolysaccharide export LptBFGC system permease protein LptF